MVAPLLCDGQSGGMAAALQIESFVRFPQPLAEVLPPAFRQR
jgi:hypothetical protein